MRSASVITPARNPSDAMISRQIDVAGVRPALAINGDQLVHLRIVGARGLLDGGMQFGVVDRIELGVGEEVHFEFGGPDQQRNVRRHGRGAGIERTAGQRLAIHHRSEPQAREY